MGCRLRTFTRVVPAGSTSPLTTIAHDEGEVPSFLLVFGNGGAAPGLVSGHVRLLFGMTDGTRHYGWGAQVQDGATTLADAEQEGNTGRIGAELDYAGNAVTGVLNWTSWDETDIVLTPSDAFAADMHITIVVGFGFQGAYVDAFTTAANGNDITRTGIPFPPDCVLAHNYSASISVSPTTLSLSFGAATALAQWAAMASRTDAGSNYTWAGFKTGRLIVQGTSSFAHEYQLLNFTSDGGVIDRVVGTGTQAVALLWLKGGSPVVGTFSALTSPGQVTIPTIGHGSRGCILASRPGATVSDTATAEGGEMVMGVIAGLTDRRTWWYRDYNAEPLGGGSPSDPLAYHTDNKAWERQTRTGTDAVSQASLMDVLQIVDGRVVLDQTVADVASLIGFASWGDHSDRLLLTRRRRGDRDVHALR